MIALILLLLASPVLAHGSASWIMADPQTTWCCNRDCRRLQPGEVQSEGGKWTVNGIVPQAVYPTKPEGGPFFWGCFYEPDLIRIRCLFVPAMF